MTRSTLIRTARFIPALLLTSLAIACGGETAEDADKASAKLQAATAGSTDTDACAANDWYGDGECDTFCALSDTDCAPAPGDAVVCAAFIEEANGVCSRPETDACRMQDPDCGATAPDPGGVACALISEVPNGSCDRDPADPCRMQDPDCGGDVACAEYIEEPDGVCSREPSDPCIAQDPDCGGVACAAYIEESDGVCSREASDPCISQDPDCGSSVPGDPGDPTDPGAICLAYVEVPNGTCDRPADDPCISQDPDCVPTAEPCDFVVDGVCFADGDAACAAAGCAPEDCMVLESYPAQVRCPAE